MQAFLPGGLGGVALVAIGGLPAAVRAALVAIPAGVLAQRPTRNSWSVIEYLCHVRDVYISYTIRLYRARTEDRPVLEPMLNDLRASRFRYMDRDVYPVLDELTASVSGFCEEVAQMRAEQWDRVVTRLPGGRNAPRAGWCAKPCTRATTTSTTSAGSERD